MLGGAFVEEAHGISGRTATIRSPATPSPSREVASTRTS